MTNERSATALLERPAPQVVPDQPSPFPRGAYFTDEISLYNIVGELAQAPTLRLVEDCNTLDVIVMTVEELYAAELRLVASA